MIPAQRWSLAATIVLLLLAQQASGQVAQDKGQGGQAGAGAERTRPAGAKLRFAMAGLVDADGDGKSDAAVIKQVITLYGGVVDAVLDEQGKQTVKITRQTRWLIIGAPPDAAAGSAAVAAFERFVAEADALGLERIKIELGARTRHGPPPSDADRAKFRRRRTE